MSINIWLQYEYSSRWSRNDPGDHRVICSAAYVGWTDKHGWSVWRYSYMETCVVRLRIAGNPSVRNASSTTVIRAGYLQLIIQKHNQSADWPGECHGVRNLIIVTILINASKPQSFDLTFRSSLFRIISILNVFFLSRFSSVLPGNADLSNVSLPPVHEHFINSSDSNKPSDFPC
jgi:hypothetical protein